MASIYRPTLTSDDVPPLVQKLYGLDVRVLQELDSYDDQNFLVVVIPGSPLPSGLTSVYPHGYVFKILNSLESEKTDVVDTQTQIILHTQRAGYPTHGPIETLKQHYQEPLELPSSRLPDVKTEKYIARLFNFMPGKTLDKVTLTQQLCYEIGWYAGQIDTILKEFPIQDNPTLALMFKKWNMSEIPKLRDKLHTITKQEEHRLVEDIFSHFEENILQCQEKFSKGLIHGDFNDCNILVGNKIPTMSKTMRNLSSYSSDGNLLDRNRNLYFCSDMQNKSTAETVCHSLVCEEGKARSVSGESFHVTGIIDFGDTTVSLYIFEVATAMAYVMLNTHGIPPMQAASHVLRGYLEKINLSQLELEHLKLCICARFAQSLTLGYFSFKQDPGNDYIMVHVKRIWPVLETLWRAPDLQVLKQLMENVNS